MKTKLFNPMFFALTASLVLFLGFEQSSYAASTASATANATATVLSSIAITKTRDLQFGNSAPGDGTKAVLASDATNSAAFTVSGSNNAAYNVTLPADGTVTMITGTGASASQQIGVNTFTSSPSTSGTLSATGTQTLTVGATRAAISATQTPGSYSGSFTVTVTYQ